MGDAEKVASLDQNAAGPSSSSSSRSARSPEPDVAGLSPADSLDGEKKVDDNEAKESGEEEEKPQGYKYNPGNRRKTDARIRQHVWQFWRPRTAPPPPPLTMDEAEPSPIISANIISKLTFQWATPIMVLGYKRALEATDLNKLHPDRESSRSSQLLIDEWDRRAEVAKQYNKKLAAGEIPVGFTKSLRWRTSIAFRTVTGRRGKNNPSYAEREARWRAAPPPGAWDPPAPKKKGKGGGGKPGSAPTGPKPKNFSGWQRASLIGSLHPQMSWMLWSGVGVKVLGDTAQMTAPLVLRKIIAFGQERYAAHLTGQPLPNIGAGIGWAFLLFFMQFIAAVFTHQFFFRTMSVGVFTRSALIGGLFRRATKMNPKDRSPGKLLNHASTDVSRIDFASAWAPLIFTTPIQLAIGVILLIVQIGPSALVGLALLVVSMPMQAFMVRSMFASRGASMQYTDQRSKLINELLGGMRIVKSFSYENNFLKRLAFIRRKELQGIRKLLVLRSIQQAISFTLPTLAAVVSFVVYYTVRQDLQATEIFTALTLFQLLRMPLMFLPLSLSSGSDAYNAFLRLRVVFEGDQIEDEAQYNLESADALQIVDGTFQWYESTPPTAAVGMGDKKDKVKAAENKRSKKDKITAADSAKVEQAAGVAGDSTEATVTEDRAGPNLADGASSEKPEEKQAPFMLSNLDLNIPKGQLCAIVGPVGCGKSSLLSACLGEMPKKGGVVTWGTQGVAYVPQTAWIQAATVRENIVFGQPFDATRYWRCVGLAELDADLAALPHGDSTGIGERGITLSGGQKQRVSIARALYFQADVYLFDDILSALDAHVGKAIFQNAILDLKARGKTVILVTHALHHLHSVDRIVTMTNGAIAESGTYEELRARPNGAFANLMAEFGGEEEEEVEAHVEDEAEAIETAKKKSAKATADELQSKQQKKDAGDDGVMTREQRNTGSVSFDVYRSYLKAGRGEYMLPLVIFTVCLMQGATVMNSYWLVFWQDQQFGDSYDHRGLYMGVYAALGIAQAIMTFAMGFATSMLSFWACANLHHEAMRGIIFAKMSFFDTTPVGRIMNILTKDIDVADNQLADAFRMALNTLGTVAGSVILITVLTHYFVVIVAVLIFAYYFGAMFYRSSAREVKRLDAILRSTLYAHFGESLSGLVVIRAYNEVQSFVKMNMKKNDEENRAYFITIVNQRWLGIRLDFLGSILTLVVAIMVAATSASLSPAQVGVALSYVVSTAQSFSWMTRQVAEVENDMNSVERIAYYANSLDQEASQETGAGLPASWPSQGEIDIKGVSLRYREGLPLVLSDVNLHVEGGEKVGIVGRTGAGKSSLLTALLRLVELNSGSVKIDGIDVAKVGLADLRRRIAMLPQDPLIFSGTLRSNLDPFGEYDDARLNDALKRAYLNDDSEEVSEEGPDSADTSAIALPSGSEKPKKKAAQRFSLDSIVEEEGGNLSLGQRSLVSLARALVKDSQIILLDEATASVDVKTDARIQETIRTEFGTKTLLCIAHRLRTIITYDKVAVMDKGAVVEYDHPLVLYDKKDSIFRDMCLKASITREEMLKAEAL
ncbi:putative YOR1-ABC transporter [Microstroma glucosiphilum]|uniref:Putative YOR1-ABC transporter n=1 Tax=Pseudomicrostroma glucosiphilum TaxID=1684307 RepID=A0A316U2A5_9BASI|nr:putative YOR1-ABC transporter [Pseudomicrostroma glucosiphilum]PWN19482.1 putative YOR1-ABC transporter [Pseudomicrostroma glucosiphilum]